MGRASIIEAYIKRLLELKQPLTESILKAIAEEVGITEGELDAIDLQVQVHLNRGYNYIEFDNLDKAISELTRAKALNPVNLEVLNALANAYNLRYRQDISQDDRQQALNLAKRCLELKPDDQEALHLVRVLEDFVGLQNLSLQAKPNIFILIGFLENCLSPELITQRTKTKIALVLLFLQQPISFPTAVRWTIRQLVLVGGSVAAVGLTVVGVNRLPMFSSLDVPPDSVLAEGEKAPAFDPGPNVPVLFKHPGLLIEPRFSRLGEYDGEPYYKLHGIVINDSGQEVRKLNLKVELLDGDGDAISTINQITVTGNDAIIRPGDTRAFRLFHKITPALIRVRVSVIDIEQVVGNETNAVPAPKRYSLNSFTPDDRKPTLVSHIDMVSTQQ